MQIYTNVNIQIANMKLIENSISTSMPKENTPNYTAIFQIKVYKRKKKIELYLI